MSAYMVFMRTKTIDASELATYGKEVGSTTQGHPMKALAFYGAHEDLEGPATEGTVILEFPSVEAAKAWYNSPAYRQVREHRFKGAESGQRLCKGCKQRELSAAIPFHVGRHGNGSLRTRGRPFLDRMRNT